jgi:hypothetical protein
MQHICQWARLCVCHYSETHGVGRRWLWRLESLCRAYRTALSKRYVYNKVAPRQPQCTPRLRLIITAKHSEPNCVGVSHYSEAHGGGGRGLWRIWRLGRAYDCTLQAPYNEMARRWTQCTPRPPPIDKSGGVDGEWNAAGVVPSSCLALGERRPTPDRGFRCAEAHAPRRRRETQSNDRRTFLPTYVLRVLWTEHGRGVECGQRRAIPLHGACRASSYARPRLQMCRSPRPPPVAVCLRVMTDARTIWPTYVLRVLWSMGGEWDAAGVVPSRSMALGERRATPDQRAGCVKAHAPPPPCASE